MHFCRPYPVFTEFYYKYSDHSHNIQWHSHPQFEIYYFHSGKCDYLLGDRIIHLTPGDIIIMNGMTKHCPKVDPNMEYVRTMFLFDPAFVQIYGKFLLACNPLRTIVTMQNYHFRLNSEQQVECEDILRRMNRFYEADEEKVYNRFLMAFYDLLMFIDGVWFGAHGQAEQPGSDKERHVQAALAFIESHFAEEIRLEHLEKELHINKHHLTKIFREITGYTIFDYLYRRRISQAKILFFHKNENSVTEVSRQVGFKYVAHFSRLFKEQVGTSPDHYRKLLYLR